MMYIEGILSVHLVSQITFWLSLYTQIYSLFNSPQQLRADELSVILNTFKRGKIDIKLISFSFFDYSVPTIQTRTA